MQVATTCCHFCCGYIFLSVVFHGALHNCVYVVFRWQLQGSVWTVPEFLRADLVVQRLCPACSLRTAAHQRAGSGALGAILFETTATLTAARWLSALDLGFVN